jgi:quercetin dioxygenase-like cupin family protein
MVTESSPSRSRITALLAVAVLSLLLAAWSGDTQEPAAEAASSTASAPVSAEGREVLLDAQELTTLDQPVKYPKKTPAQVSSVMVTLEPGQETGWHKHRVPLYVYVLEGTLSVEYDAGVMKEYSAGTAYLEAQDVWHNGTNTSDETVRALTVYMGAEGAKNTIERAP